VGELGERESGLLLSNGTAGEVRLAESARGVGGVVEFDAFVEALNLVILDSGSVYWSVLQVLKEVLSPLTA
jgi:hypothetical protein